MSSISITSSYHPEEEFYAKESVLIGSKGNIIKKDKGVFRFVQDAGYTDNFSFQWKKFKKIQLDQIHHGEAQSFKRFFKVTGWTEEELNNKNVLEAGSGAGRFTKVVLDNTAAILYSFDYSYSVDSNYENNGPNDRLILFQADVYNLPFKPRQFDKVFSFGLLQFTPDPEKTVSHLCEMVNHHGEIVIDFFPYKGFYTRLNAKYLLRPFLKGKSNNSLLNLITKNIDTLIFLYDLFEKLGLGRLFNRFLPICDLKHTLPDGLTKEERREWAILDTFNMFSPKYDQPQKIDNVISWIKNNGLSIKHAGFIEYEKNNVAARVIARRDH